MGEEQLVEVLVTNEAYDEIKKHREEAIKTFYDENNEEKLGMTMAMSIGEYMSYLALIYIQTPKIEKQKEENIDHTLKNYVECPKCNREIEILKGSIRKVKCSCGNLIRLKQK